MLFPGMEEGKGVALLVQDRAKVLGGRDVRVTVRVWGEQ